MSQTMRIENCDDLKREVARLRILKDKQENRLKESVVALQESFSAENIVREAASSIFTNIFQAKPKESNISLGLSFLANKVIFPKSSPFNKRITQMLIHNLTHYFMEEKGKRNFIGFLQAIIEDFLSTEKVDEESKTN